MWHMGDGWGWWMVMGWVWMVAFWGLVIWAVYALITRTSDTDDLRSREDSGPGAQEILAQRYARGELSADEFEQMRERLTRPAGESRTTNGATKGSTGTPVV
jgi:putative membrane protein